MTASGLFTIKTRGTTSDRTTSQAIAAPLSPDAQMKTHPTTTRTRRKTTALACSTTRAMWTVWSLLQVDSTSARRTSPSSPEPRWFGKTLAVRTTQTAPRIPRQANPLVTRKISSSHRLVQAVRPCASVASRSRFQVFTRTTVRLEHMPLWAWWERLRSVQAGA